MNCGIILIFIYRIVNYPEMTKVRRFSTRGGYCQDPHDESGEIRNRDSVTPMSNRRENDSR